MPVATSTEVNPGLDPIAGARVILRLITSPGNPWAPGYVPSSNLTVADQWETVTDEDGIWSTPDVPATDDVVPSGSVYVADVIPPNRHTYRHVFTVPDSPGPHRVEDNLADPPADMPTLLADVVAELAVTVAAMTTTVNVVTVRSEQMPEVDPTHPTYGADPTGASPSDDAFDAAGIVCWGAPSAPARHATRVLKTPPGTYKLTRPQLFRSIIGAQFHGAGPDATRFILAGDFGDADVFSLDGCTNLRMGGFSVEGLSTAPATCERVIHLHYKQAVTARSTTNCSLRDITVRSSHLTFVIPFAVEEFDGTAQNDHIDLFKCAAYGSWSVGNADTYQHAFSFGSDVSGDTLDIHARDCSAIGFAKGVSWRGCNGSVDGFQAVNNGTDFYSGLPKGPVGIRNVRSEGSQRLFESSFAAACAQVDIDNVLFNATGIHSDGYWIMPRQSGMHTYRNVRCSSNTGPVVPKIWARALGGSSTRMTTIADAVASSTALASAFTCDASTILEGRGYNQVDPATFAVLAQHGRFRWNGSAVVES